MRDPRSAGGGSNLGPCTWLGPAQNLEVGDTDLGRPSHGVKGLFSSLLLSKLFARAGALTLFDVVDCSGVGQSVSQHSPTTDRR